MTTKLQVVQCQYLDFQYSNILSPPVVLSMLKCYNHTTVFSPSENFMSAFKTLIQVSRQVIAHWTIPIQGIWKFSLEI